jgi:uncharacterized membrane protein YcaP (DUF421 family)
MRFMGKRMSTQVSRIELAALVSLASAIGVPLLSPTNGILPAFIICILIVGMSRLIAAMTLKSKKFETVAMGDLDLLVEDSVMHLDIMKRVRITRERLFAQLRSENVKNLGAVKRLYMEANGTFSIVENDAPQPGLLVLPDWDEEFISENLTRTNITICKECGAKKPQGTQASDHDVKCTNCGANEWTKAVVDK